MNRRERGALRWWHGWAPIVVMPSAVLLWAPAVWPRWAVMWTLAFAIYCGCKWLTWRRTALDGAPRWRHAGYLLVWPGLDAAAFLYAAPDQPPVLRDCVRGVRNFLIGVTLFFAVARFVADRNLYVAGCVGMAGVVLVLHFGLFHILSWAWRRSGVDARPLMNAPVVSTSLGEFWGRRWNTAFRDFTHRFLFRPLTRLLGVRAGIAGGFVFSGLIHELVVSVPAGGGYGGPTAFFVVQGLGIFVERSKLGAEIGLGRGTRGWLFAMLLLVIPAPLLFHRPFVERIVVPFMQSMGAI